MTSTGHVTNPLATVAAGDLKAVAHVEHHFLAWEPTPDATAEVLAGRALMSAVLFGGLNDPACWPGWLKAAMAARRMQSHQSLWFQIQGRPARHPYRLWYPDPVTGCHLQALRAGVQDYRSPSAPHLSHMRSLQETLTALAVRAPGDSQLQEAAEKGPDWLNKVCAARLHLRIPGLLAEHAAGKTHTHARGPRPVAAEDPLQELDAFLATAEPLKPWQPVFKYRGFNDLRQVFFPADHDAFASSRKQRAKMLRGLDDELSRKSHKKWKNSIHRHMVIWLKQRLNTRSPSTLPQQGPIKPSTARRYLFVLASYDWKGNELRSILNEGGIAALSEAFATLHEESASKSLQQQRTVAAVLTSFSTYLQHQHAAIPIWSPRSEGTAKRGLPSPRRTVLDNADFTQLLGLLDAWGALTPTAATATLPTAADNAKRELPRIERVRACQLAASLMFRTGLRGREVTNLALNDIIFEGDFAELVVRGNASRSNKNRFARRTLPLHALLERDEFERLRRWHANRCNEEFRLVPRARLFSAAKTEGLSVDQYVLEPIDAAIRILFEGTFDGAAVRKRIGYWYALASPLRHSFANHLIACLNLPDEPVKLPPPSGLTPDLVSLHRKQRLSGALLRSRQHGLAIMQAVRYVMGHASYKRALETYIHNVDWVLAVHLWRDVHQPSLTAQESSALLRLVEGDAKPRTLLSDRQMRRHRAKAAKAHSAPSVLPRPRRGRPSRSAQTGIREPSATYNVTISQLLPDTVFGPESPANPALAIRRPQGEPLSECGWLVIHNFLCLRAKQVGPDEIAEQLAVPEAVCRRWAQRADELAAITKRPRKRQQSAGAEFRFPQLSGGGFPHPRNAAAALLIDQIWAQRGQLEKPRRWALVLKLLSRWQADPPEMRSVSALHALAAKYQALGIPVDQLAVRGTGTAWEPYQPDALVIPGGGTAMQLAPVRSREQGGQNGLLHNIVLHALLMMLIASEKDFERIKDASTERKSKRLPQRQRPVPQHPTPSAAVKSWIEDIKLTALDLSERGTSLPTGQNNEEIG